MPCDHACPQCAREEPLPHEKKGNGTETLFGILPSCHIRWSGDKFVKGSPPFLTKQQNRAPPKR